MNTLAKFGAARRALAEAHSVDEVKTIRDRAEALRAYSKQAGESLEMQNQIAEIKLRAERRAGELLGEMESAQGKRTDLVTSCHQVDSPPTLSDLGISRKQSSRWQQEASVPEEAFEGFVAQTKDHGRELTSAGLLREARKHRPSRAQGYPLGDLPPKQLTPPRFVVGRAENLDFLDDGSVDLIITSPPYNLGHGYWPMGGEGREPRSQGIGYTDRLLEHDYQRWQVRVLEELFRVAKEGASLFYNHKVRQKNGAILHPMDWLRSPSNPWIIRQEIIWDRGSTHNHCPELFWPEDERVYWLTKGSPQREERPIGMSSVWNFAANIPLTSHPAPFPPELPRRCLRAIGRSGGVVLDPFGGSMTTCWVAWEMGYQSIGVDVNPEYVQEAQRLLDGKVQTTPQGISLKGQFQAVA